MNIYEQEDSMKRRIILTGFAVIFIMFTLVLGSCKNPMGSGGGSGSTSIKVINQSSSKSMWVWLCRWSDDFDYGFSGNTGLTPGSSITFTDVPTGIELYVYVEDYWDNYCYTNRFTLSRGQSKTFYYNGTTVK